MGQITGKLTNDYPKFNAKTGVRSRVYVYALTMDDADKEQYMGIQGANYREDEETGQALFFQNAYKGEAVVLNFSQKGDTLYIDDSMFDKINDMCIATPAMAGAMAGQFLASLGMGNLAQPQAQAPTQAPAQAETQEQMGDDEVA